ncbi:hypothetical protein [Paenibacillus bovis]|uniref:hypothetical protein n=1 Tax=Paenibacillus bovis TaxID=1616788 RepID=UPI000AEC44E0|nr:hypothetical protein [Paenibacillus bovis]
MRTLLHIGKWIVFTPLVILAGMLNLDDYVLFFKDMMRSKPQNEGQAIYNQIENVRSQ